MLAHCAYEISSGQDCVFRPPEEYVLNVAQIALTAEAQGFGKTSKGGKASDAKLLKELPPTVVLVTSKNLQGDDVTSTVCTLDSSCRQCSVALSFGWDEDVKFSLHPGGGQGPVSLTGYLQPSPEGMDNEDDMGYGEGDSEESGENESDEEGGEEEGSSDESSDEDEDEGMAPLLVGHEKRKRSFDLDADALDAHGNGSKKKAAAEKKRPKKEAPPEPEGTSSEEDGEEDGDDDESSEDGDDDEESKKASSKARGASAEDDDDEDDDESGSESDEESGDEDDEGEPASPEEAWVKAIKGLLKEKGGKASMSHVGNVKPVGLTTKVGAFLKSRPEFKVEGNSVVLA